MAISYTQNQTATVTQVRTSGKSKLSCITIERKNGCTQDLYLQLFDHAGPTVGVDAPTDVIQTKATANEGKSTSKVVFAGKYGGKRYNTGLAYAATTTPTGNTAPTAGQEPTITVHYEPLT